MRSIAHARRIRFRGEVESRHDADDLLEMPGDTVLVNRGRPRSLVMACPDGCGSTLTVNLDRRTGKAWRLYNDPKGMTLHPSVWRDGGCEAHFIVWRNHVVWCGMHQSTGGEPEYDSEVESRIADALSFEPMTPEEIADKTDDIPWEVNRALARMTKKGMAQVVAERPLRYTRTHPTSANLTELPARGVRRWLKRLLRRPSDQ